MRQCLTVMLLNGEIEIIAEPSSSAIWDLLVLLNQIESSKEYNTDRLKRRCVRLLRSVGGDPILYDSLADQTISSLFEDGKLLALCLASCQYDPIHKSNDKVRSSGRQLADQVAQLMVLTNGSPVIWELMDRLSYADIQALLDQYHEHRMTPQQRRLNRAGEALEKMMEQDHEFKGKVDEWQLRFLKGENPGEFSG